MQTSYEHVYLEDNFVLKYPSINTKNCSKQSRFLDQNEMWNPTNIVLFVSNGLSDFRVDEF